MCGHTCILQTYCALAGTAIGPQIRHNIIVWVWRAGGSFLPDYKRLGRESRRFFFTAMITDNNGLYTNFIALGAAASPTMIGRRT
jgi:hypothetical protein